jgi:hypothetical protein
VQTAVAYGSTCFLEATSVAEGRGTTTPFEQFGAPFLVAQESADYLNDAFNCPKDFACFRAAYFQPTFSKYNNTAVPGVQWLHERVGLQTPSNGGGCSSRSSSGSSSSSGRSSTSSSSTSSTTTPPPSSVFAAGVQVLVGLRALSSPPEAFVWDGSWFGHPGSELIDMYAGKGRVG